MNPAELAEYEAQRRTLTQIRSEARRWLLRGVLLLVISVVSFTRGGSFFVTLGIILTLLAVVSYSISREATRIGDEAQRKLGLLEASRAAATTSQRADSQGP